MLILDEATSALDATSEDLVRKAVLRLIKSSKKTVLIIAHRYNLFCFCFQFSVKFCNFASHIVSFLNVLKDK